MGFVCTWSYLQDKSLQWPSKESRNQSSSAAVINKYCLPRATQTALTPFLIQITHTFIFIGWTQNWKVFWSLCFCVFLMFFLLILCCVSYVLNIKRLKENGSFIHPRWEVSTGSSPHPFTSESYELAWTTHDEFWENSRKLQVLSPTAVAPNPRAVGRHRSVGQLVLSRTESIHNLHCFCFVYFLIVNKYLFWKLLDSLHHIWLSWCFPTSAAFPKVLYQHPKDSEMNNKQTSLDSL